MTVSNMRDVACPICGPVPVRRLYAGTVDPGPPPPTERPYEMHYQINQCSGCSLVYSSPILDEAEVAALYTGAAHTNVLAGEEENVRRTFAGYYELARPFLRQRRRMVDVGCDIGLLLAVARADGFSELIGLEPNARAAARAAAVPGSRIEPSFYQQRDFAADSLDFLALIHVLDHLVDINGVLRKIQAELAPGGVVLAVVHNVASLLARVLGERFPPYNLYHHYFFSPGTIRRLFEHAGFEVVRVAPTYNRYSLGFLAGKLPVGGAAVRGAVGQVLGIVGLADASVRLPLGNIALVARKR